MRKDISSTKDLLASMHSSVRQGYIFDKLKSKLGHQSLSVPGLDVEMRWSLTFIMVKKSYKDRRMFSAMGKRRGELQYMPVLKHRRKKVKAICEF